ncbi:MAG TPA: tetratricopeptide repeat protein [Candidatus Hydrogenedentes bacterium]|nr:tetratricopeptide repeat protein [Candidatus Hydrogenedentota bacterium]
MRRACSLMLLAGLMGVVAHAGEIKAGVPAPPVEGETLAGQAVSLDQLLAAHPKAVVLLMFSPGTGEDLALALEEIYQQYGAERIPVVAVGLSQDETALADFARRMGLTYHVIPETRLKDGSWARDVGVLPVTCLISPVRPAQIDDVLAGGGVSSVRLIQALAEDLFRKRADEALGVADAAVKVAPDDAEVRRVRARILADQGKLDEAEKEFGAIDDPAGLAEVALKRGDADKAMEIAASAPENPRAAAVRAEALAARGQLDDALAAVQQARSAATGVRPWELSTILNLEGRLLHTRGDAAAALEQYRAAVDLDRYNVEALANQGETLRQLGEPEKAKETLEKAVTFRDEPALAALMARVAEELQWKEDTARQEQIRAQIETLSARFREAREKDAAEGRSRDTWTSPPLVFALLPGIGGGVFFERAGTDALVSYGIEQAWQAQNGLRVVERAMLDKLLQELNLGASDLASPDTQRKLGSVLSASHLAFLEFARSGARLQARLKLVETETTEIVFQQAFPVDEADPASAGQAIARAVWEKVGADRELKGLLADVTDKERVMINLGGRHGVRPGQSFTILEEGPPVEAGGRVIAYRSKPVGHLIVNEVEAEFAVGAVTAIQDGVTLRANMKIRGRLESPGAAGG